jgi:hypothetical protein
MTYLLFSAPRSDDVNYFFVIIKQDSESIIWMARKIEGKASIATTARELQQIYMMERERSCMMVEPGPIQANYAAYAW